MRHERRSAELQHLLLRLLQPHGLRAARGHAAAIQLRRAGAGQRERDADEQHSQRQTGKKKFFKKDFSILHVLL